MEITTWLAGRSGWAHRSEALEAGWTRYRLEQALHAKAIVLTARKWVHLPRIDPDLHLAMTASARLTCVSAARMLGLWVPRTPERVHLSVSPHSGRDLSAFVVHRNRGPAIVLPRSPVDVIENVLARVATCLPYVEARAIWESATHTHRVTAAHLRAIEWTTRAAQGLAREVSESSDSGLESIFVHRMSRLDISLIQQVYLLGHPVDALIGRRLVIQIDGLAHHQGAERRRDIAHDRRLRLAGYTVLRFDYAEVMHRWDTVENTILAAIAQRLHLS